MKNAVAILFLLVIPAGVQADSTMYCSEFGMGIRCTTTDSPNYAQEARERRREEREERKERQEAAANLGKAIGEYRAQKRQQRLIAYLEPKLDETLRDVRGRPVDAMVNLLGFPTAERTILGRHLVDWERSKDCILTVEIDEAHNVATIDVRGTIPGCADLFKIPVPDKLPKLAKEKVRGGDKCKKASSSISDPDCNDW